MARLLCLSTIIVAVLLALAGCGGNNLGGKTLYYISVEDGEHATILFDKDGTWHGVSDKDGEASGVWQTEGEGNVVLTTASGWSTFTLEPADGGAWHLAGGRDWEVWYPSEEEATGAVGRLLDDASVTVQDILEGTDWVASSSHLKRVRMVDETISFSSGEATFQKGEYEPAWSGPDSGLWNADDHSGSYVVKVDQIGPGVYKGTIKYEGTIDIGGESVDFKLGDSLSLRDRESSSELDWLEFEPVK